MIRYATVRIASPPDLPEVRQVAEASWHHTYRGMLSEGAIDAFLRRAYSEYSLRQTLNGGGLWVLESCGSLGGFLRLSIQGTHGQVNALYLLPALQGQGHGLLLWDRAQAWFVARGVHRVRLTVAERNRRARRFYRKLGFQEGELRRASFFGESLDERVCVLELTAARCGGTAATATALPACSTR